MLKRPDECPKIQKTIESEFLDENKKSLTIIFMMRLNTKIQSNCYIGRGSDSVIR